MNEIVVKVQKRRRYFSLSISMPFTLVAPMNPTMATSLHEVSVAPDDVRAEVKRQLEKLPIRVEFEK